MLMICHLQLLPPYILSRKIIVGHLIYINPSFFIRDNSLERADLLQAKNFAKSSLDNLLENKESLPYLSMYLSLIHI